MNKKETVFFVGIGGIGMSALAQLYLSKGMHVAGSDRGGSKVTKLLEDKGVSVHIGHDAENIPRGTTLLVYSDAVPEDNVERVRARKMGVQELSYFEALGEATREGMSIVVAGTHGKTTTTAMLAKVLIEAGENPTVIAGSILSEYGSNFVEGRTDLFVIEGCEYRRHFLHLHPDVLVINNIELDHTDYYENLEDMQSAFRQVIGRLSKNGVIVTNTTSETIVPVIENAENVIVPFQGTVVPELLAKGTFNKENARAAKTATLVGFPEVGLSKIDEALRAFTGTWRRFEYKGVTKNGAIVYDDYAHHPTAVSGTITMVMEEFADKKLTVVFHPHLYSRTKKFFDEFAEALSLADEVIILPIFAAREKEDPTVRSEVLVEAINYKKGNAQYAESFEEVKELLLKKGKNSLVVTMGAGDVYLLGDDIVA